MSYYGYPQRKKRPIPRKKLGKGYRSNFRGRGMKYYQPQMYFVPRTMGPFANSESKYFDSYLSAGPLPEGTGWAGSELDPAGLDCLFAPTEGNDINNRVGRKVHVYKIALRGIISTPADGDEADALSGSASRIIVYMDTQTNATQVQAETLMSSPGAATSALKFSTFQNLASLGRFRVLRDKVFRSPDVTSGTDGANTLSNAACDIPFKFTINFKKPILVNFNSTNGGDIADIIDNSFHVIGTSSNQNFTKTISYQCRTYYKDK